VYEEEDFGTQGRAFRFGANCGLTLLKCEWPSARQQPIGKGGQYDDGGKKPSFDAAARPTAARLRDKIVGMFALSPVPFPTSRVAHAPVPQFNVIFEAPEFKNTVLG
jgi:hypothetical protein